MRIEPHHPELSVTRQCALLELPRSSYLAYPVAPCRLDPIGYSRAIWRAEVWTMVEREV